MKLSIVVPCYNEEENVSLFHKEVKKVFDDKKISYELIFVNDGSKDNTINSLNELLKSKEKIKVINFSRNFGKEAAMYAGLKEASGEYTAIIDVDLQQNPKILLDMYEKLEKDDSFDSVACYQKERKEGLLLTFFKNCFYKIMNDISDVKFFKGASDFRMFRKNVKDEILNMAEYNRFSKGIFSFVGFNTYYLPYEVEKRATGKSSWSFKTLFNYAIDGIVGFSTFGLRMPIAFGIIALLIDLVYIITNLIIGITNIAVIIFLLLLFGGLILISLGVIGEYLARTYLEVKDRPIYIAKEIRKNY